MKQDYATGAPFKLSNYLALLYSLSEKQFENQTIWFRRLFQSYHLDVDKLESAIYHTTQSTVSETLRGSAARNLPLRLYRFYFPSVEGRHMLYNDLWSYLCDAVRTEGQQQRYIDILTKSVKLATNITPGDLKRILSFTTYPSLLEQLTELCFRIMIVLVQ